MDCFSDCKYQRQVLLLFILVFGKINMVAFGLVTGLGYFLLSFLQIYSKRIVHRLYLSNDFETIHV
jgi:hypothetical protein